MESSFRPCSLCRINGDLPPNRSRLLTDSHPASFGMTCCWSLFFQSNSNDVTLLSTNAAWNCNSRFTLSRSWGSLSMRVPFEMAVHCSKVGGFHDGDDVGSSSLLKSLRSAPPSAQKTKNTQATIIVAQIVAPAMLNVVQTACDISGLTSALAAATFPSTCFGFSLLLSLGWFLFVMLRTLELSEPRLPKLLLRCSSTLLLIMCLSDILIVESWRFVLWQSKWRWL